jgi:hypothetical protein
MSDDNAVVGGAANRVAAESMAMTDNIVKFPDAPPKWTAPVDAKMLDWLIARGYLQRSQRRNWCAVQMAINTVIYEEVKR